MAYEQLIPFLWASVLLTLMPGPDNLFVWTQSLTQGVRNGIAISLGLCLGLFVHTFAAATGLSIVIQQSALAYWVIKMLGAGYLFYLAFRALNEQKPSVLGRNNKNNAEKNFGQLMQVGFLMNILNPKVSLFFIAFLPQFINQNGFHVTLQMVILGVIFIIQALLIFGIISLLSGRLTNYLNSDRFWLITKWGKVVILAILGITLAISGK